MKESKISSRYSLIVVGLLLFGAGFTISKNLSPSSQSERVPLPAERPQSHRIPRPTSAELRQTLTSINSQSGPTRLLNLISMVERSSLDTLPDLAKHFANDEAILKLIALHWYRLDRHHCLETLLENRNDSDFPAQSIFYPLSEEWMAQDLADFVNVIDELPLLTRKWNTFTDIFCDVADLDYKTGLRLMREAELIDTAPNSTQVDQLAAENPREMAESIRQEANGHALTDGLGQVAKQWAKSEPEEALAYALALSGERGKYMTFAAIRSWSSVAPEEAGAWLAEQPNTRIRDELRPTLLEIWNPQDPEAAHQYCLTNLSGFRQRQALRFLEERKAK